MSMKKAVDDLYKFRDHYFENHSGDKASNKIKDLTDELNKILKLQKHDDCSPEEKIEHDLLKAKALNVLPDFSPEALDILTRLVKFHPKLVEAWNELGICFWKKGDLKAAKSCFENATKEGKNADALCNLSMILRQIGETPEEKLSNVNLSLEKAKEAVNLNIQDGKSWYVQGNAFLSLYFISYQNPNLLKQALSSYNQAFSDDYLKYNPDLYYNWAMALKYDENYRPALENLEKAMLYDPLGKEPKEQFNSLVQHLENMQNMIERKGKLKSRRIRELLNSLKKESKDSVVYRDTSGKSVTLKCSKFCDLQSGLNQGTILSGKVVCHVYYPDAPSFTFCMIDEDEKCFAVNVYNMLQGKGVIIGDSVTIFQPLVQHFNFTFKDRTFKFSTVRVNSPLLLEVNNRKLGSEVQAAPRLSVTLKSD